jgi:hypothetical protein
METNVLVTGAEGLHWDDVDRKASGNRECRNKNGIDLKERPARLASCARLNWLRTNVAGDPWVASLSDEPIDVVIHSGRAGFSSSLAEALDPAAGATLQGFSKNS